jgi:hypothetical protein
VKVIYDKKILLLSLGLWIFYTLTQSHHISWFDSGELAMVGQQLGISHPPGQPLYILLVHLAHLIAQWTSPALAISLIVQISVIASVFIALGLYTWLKESCFDEIGIDEQAKDRAFLIAIGTMAFLFPVWDQATRIEVYSLSVAFWIWGLVFFQRWLLSIDPQGIYRSFLLLGLCFCVNPLFAVSLLMSKLLLWILIYQRSKRIKMQTQAQIQAHPPRISPRIILQAFCFLLLGLTPYLSLWYILSQQQVTLPEEQVWIWGKFNTWQDFLSFLTGKDYQKNGLNQWSFLGHNLKIWLSYEYRMGWLAITLFALIGLLFKWEYFLLFLVSFISCGIFPFLYEQYDPSIPDFQGYFLVQRWLFAIGLFYLYLWLIKWQTFQSKAKFLLWILLIYSALLEFETKYSRSSDQLAIEISREILKDVPKNSILIVSADHVVFPMLYLQQIQKESQDVILLVAGFMSSSWYWQFVFNHYPKLQKINPAQTRSVVDRLHHLLSQNQNLPIFVENFQLAQDFGLNGCLDGWLIQVGCRVFPKRFDFNWLRHHTYGDFKDPQHDFVIYWWAKYLSAQLWIEEKPKESIMILDQFSFEEQPVFNDLSLAEKESYHFKISPNFWFVDPIYPDRYEQIQITKRMLLLNMPKKINLD